MSAGCKKKIIGRFALLVLMVFFSFPSQARMYKWVDEKGNVHFTNTVPPHTARTVSPSDEMGGDPREREMRMQQEQGNNAVQQRQDSSDREQNFPPEMPGPQTGSQEGPVQGVEKGLDSAIGGSSAAQVPARSPGGVYKVTIHELEVIDSPMGEWLALPRQMDINQTEPEPEIEIPPSQPKEKYKILPDDQYQEPKDGEKEFDFYFYNPQGGGAG